MKNVLRLLILAAAVATFTLPAIAQDTQTGAAASPCTTEAEAKLALYQKFLADYKGTPDKQKAAHDTGKDYLSKYGTCPDDSDKKIAAFIQGWVAKYEKAALWYEFTSSFDNKDYAKTFELGRTILNNEPENVDAVLLMAQAGLANALPGGPNNKSLNPETARIARRAIELIESGKAPAKWSQPFTNRDEALAVLQYAIGLVSVETSPADASAAFIKVAQSNSTFKSQPGTYTQLASLYEATELKKLVDDYKVAFPEGKEITDDLKPKYEQMLVQIGKVQDRIIDTLARAVSIMNADPKYNSDAKLVAFKKAVTTKLTNYYKARHEGSTDADVAAYVNTIMSKPLMLPGQEPEPVPTQSGTNGVQGDGTVRPAGQPAGASTPAQPAANGAKPATTPTPAKPAATTTTPPANTTPKKPPMSKTAPVTKSRARKTTSGR
jgi:hypothetical protein